jgi:hypothetical protein
LDPDLTNLLERYADGSGRYEHLDSLSNDNGVVRTVEGWSVLCARTSLPQEVRDLLLLRDGAVEAIADLTIDAGLETAAEPYINEMVPLFGPSIGVALALYQKASWVAMTLDLVTYYTSKELPIVGEALNSMRHSNEDFFKYEVARINDVDVSKTSFVTTSRAGGLGQTTRHSQIRTCSTKGMTRTRREGSAQAVSPVT